MMLKPDRTVSPGVAYLISKELQEILWNIHKETPYIPSLFDLRKGHGQTQHIYHICLVPYYEKKYTVELENQFAIRITILRTDTGLLMRLSSKRLEDKYRQSPPGLQQGDLF